MTISASQQIKFRRGHGAPPIQPKKRTWMSTIEIGELFHCDPVTVARWIDARKIPCFRTPGGHRRVDEKDVRAFAAKHGMPL